MSPLQGIPNPVVKSEPNEKLAEQFDTSSIHETICDNGKTNDSDNPTDSIIEIEDPSNVQDQIKSTPDIVQVEIEANNETICDNGKTNDSDNPADSIIEIDDKPNVQDQIKSTPDVVQVEMKVNNQIPDLLPDPFYPHLNSDDSFSISISLDGSGYSYNSPSCDSTVLSLDFADNMDIRTSSPLINNEEKPCMSSPRVHKSRIPVRHQIRKTPSPDSRLFISKIPVYTKSPINKTTPKEKFVNQKLSRSRSFYENSTKYTPSEYSPSLRSNSSILRFNTSSPKNTNWSSCTNLYPTYINNSPDRIIKQRNITLNGRKYLLKTTEVDGRIQKMIRVGGGWRNYEEFYRSVILGSSFSY